MERYDPNDSKNSISNDLHPRSDGLEHESVTARKYGKDGKTVKYRSLNPLMNAKANRAEFQDKLIQEDLINAVAVDHFYPSGY